MLPKLSQSQNIFIEITNLVHGGQSWKLGSCLWSPVYSKANAKAWKIMEQIKLGDIIIHLVKMNNQYHWYGISFTNSKLIQTSNQPPIAADWADMAPYQRINLTGFNKINQPRPIDDFFLKYNQQLIEIQVESKSGLFYVVYNNDNQLRVSQRYIAKCPEELYSLINQYLNIIGFNPIFEEDENIPTLNEPQNTDYNSPGRVKTTISRIVRDTELSRKIKAENNWKCQICGCSILLPNHFYYTEGHHLQPLGGEHEGPDIRENIIVLCPTHHAEFDYGCIAINLESGLIEHIDINNPYHNQRLVYARCDLGTDYLSYHYHLIFKNSTV